MLDIRNFYFKGVLRSMSTSLGIDAAWTVNEPSGISLIQCNDPRRCTILRAGRSYDEFISGSIDWNKKAKGSKPELDKIIDCCKQCKTLPNVISIDIPIANYKIESRRFCENQISVTYGGKGASTHSPTMERPGNIAVSYFEQLTHLGYIWKTKEDNLNGESLIEVFPHTAIIEYFNLNYRYEYKVSKKNSYRLWKKLSKVEKNLKLKENLNFLTKYLSKRVVNIYEYLPILKSEDSYSMSFLKGYEDLLDSIICALVGIDYKEHEIRGFGDESGTIWVPTDKNFL
jgi:predicted RNase H-like nuclease